MFDLAARLQASLDFPEEGYHFVAPGEALVILQRVRECVDKLLSTSASGRVIREGRHIAILGKPNVGKSSLFNQLVGTDRAIVAPGPGTTRDMLRETIDLDGIRLGLVDTAGVRLSDDAVEREGVARRAARQRRGPGVAGARPIAPARDSDRALLHETASAPRVVVVNKTDLPAAWSGARRSAEPRSQKPGARSGSEPAGAGLGRRPITRAPSPEPRAPGMAWFSCP